MQEGLFFYSVSEGQEDIPRRLVGSRELLVNGARVLHVSVTRAKVSVINKVLPRSLLRSCAPARFSAKSRPWLPSPPKPHLFAFLSVSLAIDSS
jgi:hypothetical protein